MQVTSTEFEVNLKKYLDLVKTEDIMITVNGKIIAKLCNPNDPISIISGALKGKVPADTDRHSLREERLKKYAVDD